MKVNDLFRLIRKNILLLVMIPLLMGAVTKFIIKDTFTSRSVLYTGLTSGTNVQLDQSFNLFTSNAGFDNLINIFQSRETSEDVAMHLLAMHLMMDHPDPKYISAKSFYTLLSQTPAEIRKLAVKKVNANPGGGIQSQTAPAEHSGDLNSESTSFSDTSDNPDKILPGLDPAAYKQTLKNLTTYLESSDTNYLRRLLSRNDPHYSIKAISSVNVQRIGSGDLIELKLTNDDPGICQQTLRLITEIGMKNYLRIKESRSDSVVRYFEQKVAEASQRLMSAENQLQDFEQKNNIINYDDQSRDITKITSNLESALQAKQNKLAANKFAIEEIEQKLGNHEKIQVQNSSLLDKRNKLSDINAQILMLEASKIQDTATMAQIGSLKKTAAALNVEIQNAVGELYAATSTSGGKPDNSNLINTWISSTRDYEETKNEIDRLQGKIVSSQRLYEKYVPAGVILKRLERDISVAEQEYMEVIRSLNLAKLKLQDVELSSTIRAVDPPNFPEMPDPGKRMVMILLAAVLGFLFVSTIILALEYFDESLNNPVKASRILQLEPVGVYPRIPEKLNGINFPFISERLLEMIIQKIDLLPLGKHTPFQFHTRTILFFSTLSKEGKSFLVANIARKMKLQGKSVKVITFSGESLLERKLAMTEEEVDSYMAQMNKPLQNKKRKSLNSSGQVIEEVDEIIDSSEMTLEIPETTQKSGEQIVLQLNDRYHTIKNYRQILENYNSSGADDADYILIELPPILSFSYPAELVSSADLSVMICRSTRSWSEADQGALETIMRLNRRHPLFLLNGVNLNVVKSSIGKLPKIHRHRRKTQKTS
jgi:polysaccharide biosynthesis transport protein